MGYVDNGMIKRVYRYRMGLERANGGPMSVWCPLVPAEDLLGMGLYKKNLSDVSSAYYDWCASMRSKAIGTATMGGLLDRIRMLMINVGIACGQNRELAESVQSIVASNLRKGAAKLVSRLPAQTQEEQTLKKTLAMFFARMKFIRDIDPKEEIRKAMPVSASTESETDGTAVSAFGRALPQDLPRGLEIDDKIQITKLAVHHGTDIVKALYTRLLSPDPYGNDSD